MNQRTEIIGINGKKKMIDCLGCAIQTGKVKNSGSVAETKYFEAHQDYEIPIPGFIILDCKRHTQGIDEFTPPERRDFIEFLCLLRKAIRQSLGIQTVYLIQEEDTSHHFHIWIFPRYDWMKKKFGKKIQSVRPIMEYARGSLKTEENLKQVKKAIQKIKDYLEKKSSS